MAASGTSQKLSQSDFAKRQGVNRATINKWKAKGLLAFDEAGLIDVEATEWNLDQRPVKNRGGVAHRPIKAATGNKPATGNTTSGNSADPPAFTSSAAGIPSPPDAGDLDGAIEEIAASQGWTHAEAARVKEVYLALLRKQEFEKGERALVDRAMAVKLFFETARESRDAWLAWPARVAIEMADQMKVDARTLTTVLTAHVHQHLAELGEPHADL